MAAELHLAESHYQTHAMDFCELLVSSECQEAKAREVIDHTDHVVGRARRIGRRSPPILLRGRPFELHR